MESRKSRATPCMGMVLCPTAEDLAAIRVSRLLPLQPKKPKPIHCLLVSTGHQAKAVSDKGRIVLARSGFLEPVRDPSLAEPLDRHETYCPIFRQPMRNLSDISSLAVGWVASRLQISRWIRVRGGLAKRSADLRTPPSPSEIASLFQTCL